MDLPEHLFEYVSSITPLVNVDILIRNKNNEVLLAWRDDQYWGEGWHVPGGIVRFQETLNERLQKVVDTEICRFVDIENVVPVTFREVIVPNYTVRGHFISFLFLGTMKNFVTNKKDKYEAGDLMWFDRCPDNLLKIQEFYREWIDGN